MRNSNLDTFNIDSDDEAPEVQSFDNTRVFAQKQRSMERGLEVLKASKEKEQRRKRDALYKSQAQHRDTFLLEHISPDIVAKAIQHQKHQKALLSTKQQKKAKIQSANLDKELPLELSQKNIVLLEQTSNTLKASLIEKHSKILTFRQQHLYGDRIKRISSSQDRLRMSLTRSRIKK